MTQEEKELETWLPIQGYKGIYEISNLGRVKRLAYDKNVCNGGKQHCCERILKPRLRNGYLIISLCKNCKSKTFYLHRLVAMAFIPTKDTSLHIDHIDTNRINNNVNNLRWCTPIENANNPITRKNKSKSQKGRKHGAMSDDTKKKISTANTGKHHSKEHMQHYLESCKWRYKPIRVYKENELIGDYNGLNEASKALGVSRKALTNSIIKKKPNRFGYLVIELENKHKKKSNETAI